MANAVQIAAQLYDCRDTAKRFLGENFGLRMQEYGDMVYKVAAARGVGILEAGKILADPEVSGGGITAILVLAATVEIIEPSNAEVTGRASAACEGPR